VIKHASSLVINWLCGRILWSAGEIGCAQADIFQHLQASVSYLNDFLGCANVYNTCRGLLCLINMMN
jgi:hypothetical protein